MKKLNGSIVALLMLSSVFSLMLTERSTAAEILYVDDSGGADYTSIQDAINAASNGDTIYVYSGIYYEHITVDKSVSITGENKESTIVDGLEYYFSVKLEADDVALSGFTIKNCKNTASSAGLKIESNHNTINENIISDNNYVGIWIANYGTPCINNIISNNQIENNDFDGIIISSGCDSTTINGNTIKNNNNGMNLGSAGNHEIFENYVLNNDGLGISLSADNCNIRNNHIENNEQGGITANYDSSNNNIYHNYFISNNPTVPHQNAKNYGTNNEWDDGYPSGGNYWDDYNGIDTNGDGIGETSYQIYWGTGEDRYPMGLFNEEPLADAGGPYSGTINDDIIFDGSQSSDSDGSIEGYRWDFNNDGVYDTGWLSSYSTTHSYSTANTYTIKLEVKDDDGATDTDTATVSITETGNNPPIADAGGPYSAVTNNAMTFTGIGSTDIDGIIVGYRWDWTNDGSYDTSWLTSPTTTHSYSSAGTYTVKLLVQDNEGATDDDATTATVTVYTEGNAPPIADAGGPYTSNLSTITLDASGSYDPDGTIMGYRWDFENDGFGGYQIYSHSSTTTWVFSEGNHTINLEVIDNTGTTDVDTTFVVIEYDEEEETEEPITVIKIAIGGPYYGYANETIQMDCLIIFNSEIQPLEGYQHSSSGQQPNYTFYWDFGDGADGSIVKNPVHTYTKPGNYTIALTVTNEDGTEIKDSTYAVVIPDRNRGTEPVSTPGFELILVLFLLISIYLLKRKK